MRRAEGSLEQTFADFPFSAVKCERQSAWAEGILIKLFSKLHWLKMVKNGPKLERMTSYSEPDSPPPPYSGDGLRGPPQFEGLPPKPDVDDDEGGDCGWLCFQPSFLRYLRNPKVYVFFFGLIGLIQGTLVNGFVNLVVTTIEKRYYLPSSESGLVISCYDIASLVILLPVTYFGGREVASKPRWLGWGMIVLGIGSFVFTIPHWVSGKYEPISDQFGTHCKGLSDMNVTDVCQAQEDLTEGSSSSAAGYKWPFFLAQLLHGFGAAPIFTLGITYLDENVRTQDQSFYTGIFYVFVAFGPALGYLIGSEMLQIYVDFPDPLPTGITPQTYVGAWWIGFLGTGLAAIIVGWIVTGFPAKMPGAKAIAAQKVSEAYQKKSKKKDDDDDEEMAPVNAGTLTDMVKSAMGILTNPTFLAISLAGASEGFLVAGIGGFAQKILESQYMMPAGQAALLIGVIFVPAGCGGTFIGGAVVKKLKLKCRGILNFCIILAVLGFATCFVFIIQCPNANTFGLNYHPQELTISESPHFNFTCNNDCGCSVSLYDPICSADNIQFYSPCHAGCSKTATPPVYSDCDCIDAGSKNWTVGNKTLEGVAKRGKCTNNCDSQDIFLGVIFALLFVTVMCIMPALSGTLRCVAGDQRSFALGIQWIIIRLLGSIPGPIIYGSVIDTACILAETGCEGEGCLIYDNAGLATNMVTISLIMKGLSITCFVVAALMYRPPTPAPDTPAMTDLEKEIYDNPALTVD